MNNVGDKYVFLGCNKAAFQDFLKLLTAFSTALFLAGWYGADVICLIPFFVKKFLNSDDTSCGPLSDTFASGMPKIENNSHNLFIVLSGVTLSITLISGYLLNATKIMK